MTEHAELLTEARKLAVALDRYREWPELDTAATTLRTFADLVEEQERRENTIRTVLKECDAFNAELVAACVACDDAIVRVISLHQPTPEPDGSLPQSWAGLQNARHRAQRAVKLAKPKGIDETMAVATATYDDLLKRLGDAKNVPSDAERKLWSQIAPRLQRALGLAPPTPEEADAEMAEAEEAPMTDEEIERIADLATNQAPDGSANSLPLGVTDMPDRTEPSAPPVEVEMRVRSTCTDHWLWECRLAGRWFECLEAFLNENNARDAANKRLTALGDQLGVKLVADWKEGE